MIEHACLALDQPRDALPVKGLIARIALYEGRRGNRRLPRKQAAVMLRHFVGREGEVIQAQFVDLAGEIFGSPTTADEGRIGPTAHDQAAGSIRMRKS